MSTPDSRPPTEILDSISKKASDLRDAAETLTERITWFEEYLAKLPGRVETDYYGPHPDAETAQEEAEMSLVLKLHRTGKIWSLSYGSHHEGWNDNPENAVEFKPLVEAPLKFKIAAVKLFPNVLAAIEKSQDKLVAETKKAVTEVDKFTDSLPRLKERVRLDTKEGK